MDLNNYIFNLIKNKKFDELFNYIKNNDIDYDIQDENYNYLIQYLVLYNLVDIIKYILKNRTIRLDILDIDGRNILYNPIRYNYNEIFDLLLEYDSTNIGISILDVKDNMGYTCLHYSIIYGNEYVFNKLIDIINLNILDNKKNTIFMTCLIYKKSNFFINILKKKYK